MMSLLKPIGANSVPTTPMQAVEGDLYQNSDLVTEHGEITRCYLEKGTHHIIQFSTVSSGNPFRTDSKSSETLLISLEEFPEEGKQLKLPAEGVDVCFLSGAQLVLFKAFKAAGYLRFDHVDRNAGIIDGELELTLKNELDMKDVEKEKRIHEKFTLIVK
ncbi:MAG: hypothetical protein H6585_09720 [Flavobacteriales bacterium]|nr:hypothetical protein [Flavobacteriales bacterium]MCB9448608.1 hypothetical protein [Flavobacteriales bacterium]